MPNGKIGDHPFSDMMLHGMHPFPADIEVLLRKLHRLAPGFINQFGWAPFEWARGKDLDEARRQLRALLGEFEAKPPESEEKAP